MTNITSADALSLGEIDARLEDNRAAMGLVEAAIAKLTDESASLCLILKSLGTIEKKLEAEWEDVASQSRTGK